MLPQARRGRITNLVNASVDELGGCCVTFVKPLSGVLAYLVGGSQLYIRFMKVFCYSWAISMSAQAVVPEPKQSLGLMNEKKRYIPGDDIEKIGLVGVIE